MKNVKLNSITMLIFKFFQLSEETTEVCRKSTNDLGGITLEKNRVLNLIMIYYTCF